MSTTTTQAVQAHQGRNHSPQIVTFNRLNFEVVEDHQGPNHSPQIVTPTTDQAAHQHAHNALSMAAWHIARGEAPQALARLRRARSHILASMEGGAA